MLRRFQASFVLLCLASAPAFAQEPSDDAPPAAPPPTAEPPSAVPPAAPREEKSTAPPSEPGGWHMELSGYFRAPMALGISSRPAPDTVDTTAGSPTMGKLIGSPHTQVSYGPNRTLDANYYSFAYTRLQEQDWAEFFIHEKKKHVDAAIGWMGYWYQAVGFRNPDAGWGPGLAYISLDTDVEVAGHNTNIRGTAGAWWPSFGYMEVYDTYTLGRFRQMGGQLQWTVPGLIDPDLTGVFTGGFGTARDGSFNYGSPPFFGGFVALDLVTYWNAEFKYKDNLDIGIHYNTEWTADPNLAQGGTPDLKSYGAYQAAHLTVIGAQLTLHAPALGRLWISPSFISIRNGWALNSAGTEVMHSLGGAGLVTNFFGYTGDVPTSPGSGSMFNLGGIIENTLSNMRGEAPGGLPEFTFRLFGLLADGDHRFPEHDDAHAEEHQPAQVRRGGDLPTVAVARVHAPLRRRQLRPRSPRLRVCVDHAARVRPVAFPVERAHLPAVLAILRWRQDVAQRGLAVDPESGEWQQRPAAGPVLGHEGRRERRQAAGRDRFLTKLRPVRQSPS